MDGHGDGELWGLSCHPSKDIFVTSSDDKTVRTWDLKTKVKYQFALFVGFINFGFINFYEVGFILLTLHILFKLDNLVKMSLIKDSLSSEFVNLAREFTRPE